MQVMISPLGNDEYNTLVERFSFKDRAEAKIYTKFGSTPKIVRHITSRTSWWVGSTITSLFDEVICVHISEAGYITMFDQSAITQRESLTLLDALGARKESVMELGIITMPRLLAKAAHNDIVTYSNRLNPELEAFEEFYRENRGMVEEFVSELNKELMDLLEEAALWVSDEFGKRVKILASFVMGEVPADVYDDNF